MCTSSADEHFVAANFHLQLNRRTRCRPSDDLTIPQQIDHAEMTGARKHRRTDIDIERISRIRRIMHVHDVALVVRAYQARRIPSSIGQTDDNAGQEIAVSIVAELIAVKHGKIAEPAVAAVSMRWEGALKK